MSPTYFGLLAEFGEAEIPLDRMCEKYFGLSVARAKRRACLQQLPVPVYRVGSQKSPWLISAVDLANHINQRKVAAEREWISMN
ncbi:MAG TPA: pyocin activator PrtN family protein [Woeseiaceae bacterium]|nr:pyocin activator PrtN family protein [Woeseiaceae bacterium]